VDQEMLEFFPEFAGQITDRRKEQITVRDMLQMRAGFPWEETDSALWEAFSWGDLVPHIVDFPLTIDPGTGFQYSNLTSHWLGVIAARACDTDLRSFAQLHLLSPLGVELGEWAQARDGYYVGSGEMHFTARDMAKFGLLYLNDGEYEGNQVISADWVHDSLQTYSQNVSSGAPQSGKIGRYFRDIGYGYQWWSASVGDHDFNYAAGHGGQLIVLLDELDTIVITTADPFYKIHGSQAWKHEKAVFNLVGGFINSLPRE
jgi:CubicO group peptidase (beta-lactamase class C family)